MNSNKKCNTPIYEKIEFDYDLPFKLIDLYFENHSEHTIMHWHQSIEILVPILGDLILNINGREIIVPSGDLYIINSKEIHSILDFTNSPIYKGFVLQIDYNSIVNCCEDIDNYVFKQISDLETKRTILQIIYNLIYSCQQKQEYMKIKATSELLMLIYILISKLKVKKTNFSNVLEDKYHKRLIAITEYIKENYQENLCINDIAKHFDISSGYLSKLFKDNLNITPKEYISKIRLKKAYDDVVLTNDSMINIAMNHGFPNIKSFNHDFKKVYSMTPMSYRQKMRKEP